MSSKPRLTEVTFERRRQRVFLLLSGIVLGSMPMLNILGISRFVDLSFTLFGVQVPMALAVGVLPYPITFLCTDFICELYGQRRANEIVWVGFLLNLWVVFIFWLGGTLPGFEQAGTLAETARGLEGFAALDAAAQEALLAQLERPSAFFEMRALSFGAVAASMVAYLVAQLVDVHMFHFWKRLTKGKHLWLRNNGSTLVSQLVDTVAVILITHFYAAALPIEADQDIWPQLLVFIASGYVFKMVSALVDTLPFYYGVRWLSTYLDIDPLAELGAEGATK